MLALHQQQQLLRARRLHMGHTWMPTTPRLFGIRALMPFLLRQLLGQELSCSSAYALTGQACRCQ